MEVIEKILAVDTGGILPSPADKTELQSPTPPMGRQMPALCWMHCNRVQTILEDVPRLRDCLGPKTHVVKKKTGEEFRFSPETVQVVLRLCGEGKDVAKVRKHDIVLMGQRLFILKQTGEIAPGLIIASATLAPAAIPVNMVNNSVAPASGEQAPGGNDGIATADSIRTASATDRASITAVEAALDQIEIAHGEYKGVHPVHPVARMFPLIQGQAYKELLKSLQKDGQQEDCVMDGKMFLDGRNRVNGMNQLGLAPRVIQFADLKTGLTPTVWIMTKNLQRRHLTDDQQLAIAAKCRAWCKAEDDRQQAETSTTHQSEHGTSTDEGGCETTAASQTQEADGSAASDYRQKPAENQGKRKRGRPTGERTEARALAKQTKQSRYRAERILRIRAQSPELATEVEEGRMSIKKAMEQLKPREPEKKARSQPQDGVEGIVKAVEKAKQVLSKLACKFAANELTKFWQQVADFVSGQPGVTDGAK